MFSKLAVSVAVAFLGAYPFSLATGLLGRVGSKDQEIESSLIFISGLILFCLTLGLLGPTIRLIHRIVDTLNQVEERPGPAVALVILCLGALCAISAVVVQYSASERVPAGVSMKELEFGGNSHLIVQSSGSLALGVLTILTFLLGTSLISLGIWACLKPAPRGTSPAVKPAVQDLDEPMS